MDTANSQLENGETIIPASQRPDGTWRKARRVKEGYVPQEEVPLYESKGKQFTSRSSKPQSVTLPSGEVAHQTIPGLFIIADKGKSKKKKTKNVGEVTKQMEQVKIKDSPSKTTPKATKTTPKASKATVKVAKTPKVEKVMPVEEKPDVDPAKRLRNLKKRLREAEELEEKLKNGLISKPEPEQLAKVQRKNELLMQINDLEKNV